MVRAGGVGGVPASRRGGAGGGLGSRAGIGGFGESSESERENIVCEQIRYMEFELVLLVSV